MGKAIARVSFNVLEELLGLRGVATVEGILPPGMFELQRQCFPLVLESPEFPPTVPGMLIPEVYPIYEMRPNGPIFKGFEVLEDRKELPEGFVNIPKTKDPGPGIPYKIDESTLGFSPNGQDEDEPNEENEEEN